jgi:hypothetical protein
MVFNATSNNISIILWQIFSWLKEIAEPGENHQLATSNWQIYHIMLYRVHFAISGIPTHNFSGDIKIYTNQNIQAL